MAYGLWLMAYGSCRKHWQASNSHDAVLQPITALRSLSEFGFTGSGHIEPRLFAPLSELRTLMLWCELCWTSEDMREIAKLTQLSHLSILTPPESCLAELMPLRMHLDYLHLPSWADRTHLNKFEKFPCDVECRYAYLCYGCCC